MSIKQGGEVIAGGGTKDMLTQKNITNCITEIPQDIKLELNNGTLTLKAGSKVYVPNGAGVFDAITIASDKTVTPTWLNTSVGVVYYMYAEDRITATDSDYCYSGSTAPTELDGAVWYDTTNNKVKRGVSGSWTDIQKSSLPIAIVKNSSNVVTSIDQVFNGFGYIGSTTFVLPGVKGLLPNGRKADGTCNNTELNFTTPMVRTLVYSDEVSKLGFLAADGIAGYGVYNYYEQDTQPVFSGTYATWFDTKNNVIKGTADGGTTWTQYTRIYLGVLLKDVNTNITSLIPKQTFRALDYNDKKEIVAWGRQFVPANTTIAQGGGGISGSYNLGLETINTVKIGVFQASLRTTQAGYSSMAISTDVATSPCLVAGTNNQFANDGTITIPFINSVTISFPTTNGGIGTGTKLVFKGYM